MKPFLVFLAAVVLTGLAASPSAVPSPNAAPAVTYYSAAELKSLGAQLSADSKHAKFASKNLEHYDKHYTMLAHREGDGSAELHEQEADLFFVVDGTATIVTGGKMLNPKTTAPGEIRGTSIEGGQRQKLSTGDVIHIAAKTPHQLLLAPGQTFTYFVMKVSGQ